MKFGFQTVLYVFILSKYIHFGIVSDIVFQNREYRKHRMEVQVPDAPYGSFCIRLD